MHDITVTMDNVWCFPVLMFVFMSLTYNHFKWLKARNPFKDCHSCGIPNRTLQRHRYRLVYPGRRLGLLTVDVCSTCEINRFPSFPWKNNNLIYKAVSEPLPPERHERTEAPSHDPSHTAANPGVVTQFLRTRDETAKRWNSKENRFNSMEALDVPDQPVADKELK